MDSEVAAIRHSLEALSNEGLHDLAHQEAQAIMAMGSSEPYASAIRRLSDDSLWQKYLQPV